MSNAGRPLGSYTHIHPCRIDGKSTRAYSKYQAMLQRCYNPRAHNFKWYGARGITVCERWSGRHGYDHFIEDMGVPPEGMTLDREDNSGNYTPENCKWSTMKEQTANRRKRSQVAGSLRQLARSAGLPYACVYQRVKLHGWTLQAALSTPVRAKAGFV